MNFVRLLSKNIFIYVRLYILFLFIERKSKEILNLIGKEKIMFFKLVLIKR